MLEKDIERADIVRTHCLYRFLDNQKNTRSQFSIPGLRKIHRNLKQKKDFNSRESFLRKVSVCTLIDLNPGFGGPWNKLQIILVNGTFIMPQKESFGQKNF